MFEPAMLGVLYEAGGLDGGLSKAKQSKAKQSKAKQSKAKQSKAKQSKAKQCEAKKKRKNYETKEIEKLTCQLVWNSHEPESPDALLPAHSEAKHDVHQLFQNYYLTQLKIHPSDWQMSCVPNQLALYLCYMQKVVHVCTGLCSYLLLLLTVQRHDLVPVLDS